MANNKTPLPEGWIRARIDHVGAVRLGRQRSPDKQSGRFPTKYLRAGNITAKGLNLADVLEMDFTPAERSVFTLRHGDVVVTEASGSGAQVGRAAIWRDEIPGCCFQNTVIRFRPHAVTPQFGLLMFRHLAHTGVFERTARGVGIQHLGASRFAALEIAVPPLAEQTRISEIADQKLIALREAENALQSALDGTFTQDRGILAAAATGKLVEMETEGTAPEVDRFSELHTGVAVKWPPGWTWTNVGSAGDVMLGKMRDPSRHKGSNMRPYLRVANVFEARIDVTDVKQMHFSAVEADMYALQRGDILLNEGQSPELVGRPAMYNDEVPGACFQNTLLRFRAGPAVDRDFALIVFRHYLHAGEFKKVAQWSTNIAHLTKTRFCALPFPLPPMAEQNQIVAEAHRRLEASAAQRSLIQASLARIPAMVDQLFGAAVNGTLTIQDPSDEPAEAMLERLGPPPKDILPVPDLEPTDEAETVTDITSDDTDLTAMTLAEVLRSNGRPMSLPDLCYAAGFDRNDVGEIERFYVALRSALGVALRVRDHAAENAVVEVIDATG